VGLTKIPIRNCPDTYYLVHRVWEALSNPAIDHFHADANHQELTVIFPTVTEENFITIGQAISLPNLAQMALGTGVGVMGVASFSQFFM